MARRRLRVRELSRPTPTLFLMVGVVIFTLGLLAGFLLSGRLGQFLDLSAVQIMPSGGVNWLQFWGVFWSYFRWLLLAALLAMSALGLFCSIRFFSCGEYYWGSAFQPCLPKAAG